MLFPIQQTVSCQSKKDKVFNSEKCNSFFEEQKYTNNINYNPQIPRFNFLLGKQNGCNNAQYHYKAIGKWRLSPLYFTAKRWELQRAFSPDVIFGATAAGQHFYEEPETKKE